MNKKVLVLGFSLIGLLAGLLGFSTLKTSTCNLPPISSGTEVKVKEVIDGDTFKTEKGNSVRILNIDAAERGERCYLEAKNRLEELILDKKVVLKNTGIDKYCRYLGEVYKDNANIGLKLTKEGLVLAQNQSYIKAEQQAKENELGCKWQVSNTTNGDFERLTPSKTGLDIVEACDAKNQIGKEALVEGRVMDVHRSDSNTVFLNFEKVYP